MWPWPRQLSLTKGNIPQGWHPRVSIHGTPSRWRDKPLSAEEISGPCNYTSIFFILLISTTLSSASISSRIMGWVVRDGEIVLRETYERNVNPGHYSWFQSHSWYSLFPFSSIIIDFPTSWLALWEAWWFLQWHYTYLHPWGISPLSILFLSDCGCCTLLSPDKGESRSTQVNCLGHMVLSASIV